MALARIITRSHQCARELALDLIARGYAVEVVSPDKIPDNIADLELRVDASPGDQLVASVEAHDGERSASLEFVHHLKAPMMDFMRRPLEDIEPLPIPQQLSFDVEPPMEDVELPAEAPQLVRETVFAEIANPHDSQDDTFEVRSSEVDTGGNPGDKSNEKENERLISPPEPVPSLPDKPRIYFAAEASPIAERSVPPNVLPPVAHVPNAEAPIAQPTISPRAISPATIPQPKISRPTIVRSIRDSRRPDRFARWPWRAAPIFAGVLLLALVLGFGLRQTGKASAGGSDTASAEKVAAASSGVDLLNAADTEKDAGKPTPFGVPGSVKSETNSAQPAKPSAAAAPTSTSTRPHNTPRTTARKHGEDLIAHDTVTYLDKNYAPPPKPKTTKKLAHKHPVSHSHGGVIAANSVIYVDPNPAPKNPK